jgi:hypothetical protein
MSRFDAHVQVVSSTRAVTDNGWELGFDGEYWSASHPTLGAFKQDGQLGLFRSRDALLRWLIPDTAEVAG